MKTSAVILWVTTLFMIGCSGGKSDEILRLEKENAMLKEMLGPPPAILDSLYPPLATGPVYVMKMQELGGPMIGFVVKIKEGDRNGARAMFNAFREKYAEVSEMVPDWKDYYPDEPLDNLDTLIEEGEPGLIMESFQKVGDICHQCHIAQMPKVQQKYHWPEFSMISLTDPISNQDLEWRNFMMSMETSLMPMMMELQQGNMEGAIVYMDNFKKYLGPLKEACMACHISERKYFVDENVMNLIAGLEDEIKSEKPNMRSIGQLSQLIGEEMCFKCHLVHIPAAYAKSNWAAMEH